MIVLLFLILSLLKLGTAQDAVIDSRNRFEIELNEQSAYHETYLIEISMVDLIQDWSTFFLYHSP